MLFDRGSVNLAAYVVLVQLNSYSAIGYYYSNL